MFEYFEYKLGSLFQIIKIGKKLKFQELIVQTLEIHSFNYITPNNINNMSKIIRKIQGIHLWYP